MSNLEDFIAVQWTCRSIVSSDVDELIRSLGGQVDRSTLLQRAAEAVASCARYEQCVSSVDFSTLVQTIHGSQPIGLSVRFDFATHALVVVSLSDEACVPARDTGDCGDDHLRMVIESQAVRHERA
jgi:hypothetical protein